MEKSILTTVLLPLSLFIIMLGMGLALAPGDFRRVLEKPKATLLGLINQLIVLPLIGFALLMIFPMQPELAVGLMLTAACPGGATSNLISNLCNGDLALSITLTAISSLITLFTIPLIVNFALDHFMGAGQAIHLDPLKTILKLAVIILIPVGIGMFIRGKNQGFADKMEKPVKIASAVILALIILAAVIKERDQLVEYMIKVGPAALSLNLATMGIGFLSATLFRLPRNQAITISIESGIQNGTLAIAIALGILDNPAMSIPPAIYSLLMFMTGGILIGIFARKKDGMAQSGGMNEEL